MFYKTRGVGLWEYNPQSGNNSKIRDLNMNINTDFNEVDFPEGTLSLLTSQNSRLNWQANNLITSSIIGIEMPKKLNPGPLVGKITFFAPVCLLFFFIVLMTVTVIRKVNIHPMHYLFVAAGFFDFHLLFAYLVDVINVHLAFSISAITTLILVNSYMRGTLGCKFPWVTVAIAQFFYLVLFSHSFFFNGLTGLTVTIGSIMTLGISMYLTRGINWDKVFTHNSIKSSGTLAKV
ncbi:MAG: cell envelope integrity protein CreD [Lentisphaerae bacterium]|nr:cell envelope integrity protein CreD [Lentisphaerota bacterium]MCP4100113.1 cell envelope integrity protein CreD [Lentisphaerota bacterium]